MIFFKLTGKQTSEEMTVIIIVLLDSNCKHTASNSHKDNNANARNLIFDKIKTKQMYDNTNT